MAFRIAAGHSLKQVGLFAAALVAGGKILQPIPKELVEVVLRFRASSRARSMRRSSALKVMLFKR